MEVEPQSRRSVRRAWRHRLDGRYDLFEVVTEEAGFSGAYRRTEYRGNSMIGEFPKQLLEWMVGPEEKMPPWKDDLP